MVLVSNEISLSLQWFWMRGVPEQNKENFVLNFKATTELCFALIPWINEYFNFRLNWNDTQELSKIGRTIPFNSCHRWLSFWVMLNI